jgi:RNA polymerase-binding transcription factor DksA
MSAKKSPAKKAPAKAAPAKKAVAKKKMATVASKTPAPKAIKSKPAVKAGKAKAPSKPATPKAAVKSKATAKKAPAQVKKATQVKVKSKAAKTASAPAKAAAKSSDGATPAADLLIGSRKRKSTPSIFKVKKNTPVVFTLDDVQEIIKKRRTESDKEATKTAAQAAKDKAAGRDSKRSAKEIEAAEKAARNRVLAPASIADILGFNPAETKNEKEEIPRKFSKHYKLLVELRDHVREGLDIHAQDTINLSAKEDTGGLTFGQQLPEADADNFDRDFALSLLSTEQEALYEIEEAIKRIKAGTYGVCEINGETIANERLLAVPFTRYSLEGQRELERNRRRRSDRGASGIFGETSTEDSPAFTDDDSDS